MYKKILFPIIILFAIIQNTSAESGFYPDYFNSFLDGNYERQYNLIFNHVKENPGSPYNSILTDMIIENSDVYGYKKVLNLINEYDKIISENRFGFRKEVAFFNYLRFNNLTKDLTQDFTDKSEYGFLKKWKVSSRYNKYGLYDIYNEFPPETKEDGIYKTVLSEKDGYIQISDHVYPTSGVYYFSSNIQTDKEINIIIEAGEYYKLFVNDIELATNFYQKTYLNKRVFRVKGTGNFKITLKLLAYQDSKFRVWITDKNFEKTDINYISKIIPLPVSYSEHMIYPYDDLSDGKSETDDFMRAKYFYFLGSKNFLKYYKRLKNNKEAVETMEVADRLNFYSDNSHKSDIAWKKIGNLWKNDSNIPAQKYRFENEIDNGNIKSALNILRKVRTKTDYFDIEMKYLDYCYNKSYHNMFKDQLDRMLKIFPESVTPLFYKFNHNISLNNDLAEKTAGEILKIFKDIDVSTKMIAYYKSKRDYSKALEEIEFSGFTDFQKKLEIARLDIVFNKFESAHDLLINLLALNETPEILYYLGYIEEKQKRASDLYWAKLEMYNPQYDFPTDYSNYIEKNRHESRFENLRDKSYIESEIKKFVTNPIYFPKSVIYNGEFYKIYKNGKASFFKEELIYINSDEDVNRYGEYRIPFSSYYNILFARVIKKSGEIEDSYKKNTTRTGTFLTINGVEKNAIIHVAYEVNNFNLLYKGSSMLSTNLTLLQEYNQSIGKVDIKVETDNENILLYNNKGLAIKSEETENGTLYSFSASNLSKSGKRYYDGDVRKNMLSYGLTNILLTEELINWYRGYFPADDELNAYISFDKNMSEESIISQVYEMIAREFETTGSFYYNPESPENTFEKKSGTIEDKVFLTRSILSVYGIKSYPALVKDENLELGVVNLDDLFSGLLLYVPEYGIWLDYSSKYYPAGTVKAQYEGNRAVVIYDNNIDQKPVTSKNTNEISRSFEIDLSSDSEEKIQIDLNYPGTANYLRMYFLDERKNEMIVSALLTSLNNKVSIDSYNVENLDSYNKPLKVSCEGKVIGFSVKGYDLMTFNPFILGSNFTGYLVESSRNIDLVVENGEESIDKYVIHVNQMYKDDKIDLEKKIQFKNSYVYYKIRKDINSTDVFVEKKIYFPKQIISPEDFNDFVNFCISVRKMDEYRIVLKS